MTTWVFVADETGGAEYVTVVDGEHATVFDAPYRKSYPWEIYVGKDSEQVADTETTEVAAKYTALKLLKAMGHTEQTRGDRVEATGYALKILLEAYRLGNLDDDAYAEHTARVWGLLVEYLTEGVE